MTSDRMDRNWALRGAGAIAIGTAGYHAVKGNNMLRDMPLEPVDMAFVTGTYQLGTMGWLAGAALLIGAARLTEQRARNLIVGVTAVLFGFPAFGSLALTGGEISLGGSLLAVVTLLALWGRRAAGPEVPDTVPQQEVDLAEVKGLPLIRS